MMQISVLLGSILIWIMYCVKVDDRKMRLGEMFNQNNMCLSASVLCGADYVTGSNLPSHSDVQLSCFTGHRIQVCVPSVYCFV